MGESLAEAEVQAEERNGDEVLQALLSQYGNSEKIRFRNFKVASKLIQQLVDGGTSNLQVVTDFDLTLSKARTSDKKCGPAADIIRQSSLMSDEFKSRARIRFDKLLPVEVDPYLTVEQKTPFVVDSFREGFDDLVSSKTLNKTILAELVTNAVNSSSFQLRDECSTTLQYLNTAQVPVLIFSAGFGDLVQGLLREYSLNFPNIHVIANFMEFDDNGDLTGFKEPLIHTFNKNESVIPQDCEYLDDVAHRSNVILLGDSIGDVDMTPRSETGGCILRIGFLNEVNDQQLEVFLTEFDVVLLDDQTMNFVNSLLRKIGC